MSALFASSALVKQAAPAAAMTTGFAGAAMLGSGHVWTAAAAGAGLLFGALYLVAADVRDHKPWRDVLRGFAVSGLVAGVNFAIVLWLVSIFDAQLLGTYVIGALTGATGVRAAPMAIGVLVELVRRNLGLPPQNPER